MEGVTIEDATTLPICCIVGNGAVRDFKQAVIVNSTTLISDVVRNGAVYDGKDTGIVDATIRSYTIRNQVIDKGKLAMVVDKAVLQHLVALESQTRQRNRGARLHMNTISSVSITDGEGTCSGTTNIQVLTDIEV